VLILLHLQQVKILRQGLIRLVGENEIAAGIEGIRRNHRPLVQWQGQIG
jgi:hypothetical protein